MLQCTSTGDVKAVLFGLNDELSQELSSALHNLSVFTSAMPEADINRVAHSGADVVFCSPDLQLIHSLRRTVPQASILVASRFPDVSDWLDALEAGASDYCAAPFEAKHLSWILQSVRPVTRIAAA